MDISRPEFRQKKRRRQLAWSAAAAVVLIAAIVFVARLERAVPSVPRATVWIDSVREGEMIRQVRGPGKLVPREIRWITAQAGGRVERILVRPGETVEPDTLIVEMGNPDLVQQMEESRFAFEASQADLADTRLQLESQRLDQRAAVGVARAEYEGARLQAEAEKQLAEEGIVSAIQYQRSELASEQLRLRLEIEEERLGQFSASMNAQLAAQQARVEQARNAHERQRHMFESLDVRSGIAGVLLEIQVEEGQRVELGGNIARVARPDELQAELQIPETQARDVLIGQRVAIDTRNGIVEGTVSRIDPGVSGGTVQVDVELLGELPRGARPDLSVDGTIEIERLEHATFTGRPSYGQSNSQISLFKIVEEGRYAQRIPVQLGRTSVNLVEIVQGLSPGDEVILSDTSAWSDYERIRLDD